MTTNFYVGLFLLVALLVLAKVFLEKKPEDATSGKILAAYILATAIVYIWALGVTYAIRLMLR